MGVNITSCIDCGHKTDEGQLEVRCLHKSIESLRSERYLKDCEVQQIRVDCKQKSQKLQRTRKMGRSNTQTTNRSAPVYVNLKLQDIVQQAGKLKKEETKKPYNLVEKVKKRGLTMTIGRNSSLKYRNS